jgi:hypothetical protein
MVNFDINGAIIEFDEKRDNYNSIRKLFCKYADDSKNIFEDKCSDITNLKQFSYNGFDIGKNIIDDIIKKSIECIVSFGVITVDFETFKNVYCKKYLNFERLFNNLSKENLINKNKKSSTKISELKNIIKTVSNYIYDDCFNIHLAVIDVLIDHEIESVSNTVNIEDIKKSTALFNNYKDGFISKPDECRVVQQIISLNPYRKDVYEFLIKEDGDFNYEIERLMNYLGYDILEFKKSLVEDYIEQLIDEKSDIEDIKEKLIKYSKYIGMKNSESYINKLESIVVGA